MNLEKLELIKDKVKEAYLLTLKKYDEDQAKAALKDLIQNGKLDKFTNTNHVRDNLYKISCTKEELICALVHSVNTKDLSDSNVIKMVNKFHIEVTNN